MSDPKYVILDYRRDLYAKVHDPNLTSVHSIEFVPDEKDAFLFPGSFDAFQAHKVLKKLGVKNIRIVPFGWRKKES